ncbi:class I SAM-dependent methyltransferase [Streptomycetaceae bacterium NBC_01309]
MTRDGAPHTLLADPDLEASTVVANSTMNRERGLAGVNSYARELGLDLGALLRERHDERDASDGTVRTWLDLCCGSGRALVEAASLSGVAGQAFTGVDLVDFFLPPPWPAGVAFEAASVARWRPPAGTAYDLVTCVHGLHYVGDRLGLLTRAASWLAPGGLLVANLDLRAIRLPDGSSAARRAATALRAAGFTYDSRRKLVARRGPAAAELPLTYIGADDRAGPNYTGQPAVHAYYRPD